MGLEWGFKVSRKVKLVFCKAGSSGRRVHIARVECKMTWCGRSLRNRAIDLLVANPALDELCGLCTKDLGTDNPLEAVYEYSRRLKVVLNTGDADRIRQVMEEIDSQSPTRVKAPKIWVAYNRSAVDGKYEVLTTFFADKHSEAVRIARACKARGLFASFQRVSLFDRVPVELCRETYKQLGAAHPYYIRKSRRVESATEHLTVSRPAAGQAKDGPEFLAHAHGRTVASVYHSGGSWEVRWRAFGNAKTFHTRRLAQEYIQSYYADAVEWTVRKLKRSDGK